MITLLGSAALAFVIAYVVSQLLARPGGRFQILDHPNERSLHTTPIPRTGGLAIWSGVLASVGIALYVIGTPSVLLWIGAAALVVGAVSFVDDRLGMPVGLRLVAHLAAAGSLLAGGLGLQSLHLPGLDVRIFPAVGTLLTLLFVVWMTNLYNFMDGMDGFAGGMAVWGFGTLAWLAYMAGDAPFAAVCAAIAAGAGGFLFFNFPPARMFMGDTGASALGLMAAAMSLWGEASGLFPLWIAMLVFSPFVVDATVTLLRRLIRKERIWKPHRTHYYQRLVRLGWGHRKTVLVEYILMTACSLSALALLDASFLTQLLGISAWILFYSAAVVIIGRIESVAPSPPLPTSQG